MDGINRKGIESSNVEYISLPENMALPWLYTFEIQLVELPLFVRLYSSTTAL